MKRYSGNWHFLVFTLVPLALIMVDSAILYKEYRRSEAQKAIDLVRESKSLKENFTVQQYLYTTVYHRKVKGEPVEILGWQAEQPGGPGTPVKVVFEYEDRDMRRLAAWQVEMNSNLITPLDESAGNISWH